MPVKRSTTPSRAPKRAAVWESAPIYEGRPAFWEAAETRTTGWPRLVTTTSRPVRAMSSISSRHVALNWLAEMCTAWSTAGLDLGRGMMNLRNGHFNMIMVIVVLQVGRTRDVGRPPRESARAEVSAGPSW